MTAETSCVWRTGCPALIQCAAAGRCLSIPKDLADTQTEVRPSKQKLSCPFCGDRDVRAHHRGHATAGEWVIECHSCSCELTGFASEQDAWKTWNGRWNQTPDETPAPVWKRMCDEVPANGTWIWWDYGKVPMLQRAQDFASEDDGYWIEATPPLRSLGKPK